MVRSAHVTAPSPTRLDAEQFLAWLRDQPSDQRYELISGEVVAMSSERAAHALVKHAVARSLEDAVDRAALDCEVFPDGMSVVVGDSTVYEPDALVRCGDPADRNATFIDDPMIVVEVLSPSSEARDAGAKLEDYFRLPSVRHYLIVKTDTRSVIHHARTGPGEIRTTVLSGGELHLSPPGLTVGVEAFFARL